MLKRFFQEYGVWLALGLYKTVGGFSHFRPEIMRPLALILFLGLTPVIWRQRRRGQASDLDLSLIAYFFLATLGFGLFPATLGHMMAVYPVPILYALLFLSAVVPPLLGAEPFTTFFARKTVPQAIWQTDLFKQINRTLTFFWAVLFALGALSSLVPHLRPGLGWPWLFNFVLPVAMIFGVGLPVNKWYPGYRRRQLGLPEADAPSPLPPAAAENPPQPSEAPMVEQKYIPNPKEEGSMPYKAVAINGSPHVGFGNTSLILAMLREHLAQEGFELEEINIDRRHIEYCKGCPLCLEKGTCPIRDDHKEIVQQLLEADAVILASPVYFQHVTAQMKTFLDRSLGYSHRPRDRWKPGLAVSVSAGWGETGVAQYLSDMLRIFGAFAVGRLTAMASGPGSFWGREALELRAADLARDLARAVKEGRRYPPSDLDLVHWLFLGKVIKDHRELMKADYEHWQKSGILDSFEAYVGVARSPFILHPEVRQAFFKNAIDCHKEKASQASPSKIGEPSLSHPLRDLLEDMPLALNQEVAAGLTATYQFEVRGSENFTAHLVIENLTATFREGPAAKPDLIIKTPADVWLAISRRELDGPQAFMTGLFQVEGDVHLLMKLRSLFSD